MAQPVAYPAPTGRRARPVDITFTVLELVVTAFLALVATFFGLFTGMASDGCFDTAGCAERVAAGTLVNTLAPGLCWVGALVFSIVAMVRGRLAFWIPLTAVLVWLGLVVIGVAVATSGLS